MTELLVRQVQNRRKMTRPSLVASCARSRFAGVGLSLMLAVTILFSIMVVVEGHEGPHPPPTMSPAPTNSPAPSPSPSAVPTDTQSPTETQEPSIQPTFFPTTTFPSGGPTENPTSSPQPSPSPSEFPTMDPSSRPSVAPSKSFAPTITPSSNPSSAPTLSPTITHSPTKTASPTGPEVLVARGIQFRVPMNITEDSDILDLDANDEQVESSEEQRIYIILEEVIKMHLQRHLDLVEEDGNDNNTPEGVMDGTFEVEAVTISDSSLKQQQQQHMHENAHDGEDDAHSHQFELVVTLQVVAIAVLERESAFDLKLFLELFLGSDENRMAIVESFQIMHEEELTTRNEMNVNVNINGPVDTSSNSRGSVLAGTLVGLTVLSVGFFVITALRKRQRERYPNDDKGLFNLRTLTASRSDESSNDDNDDGPNKPSNRFDINGDTERSSSDDFESKMSFAQDIWPSSTKSANEIQVSSNHDDGDRSHQSFQTTEQFSRNQHLHHGDDFNGTDDDNEDGQGLVIPWAAPSHLMYTPALIETESNIEVPETPCTTFGSVFSWSRHSRRGDRSIMTKQDDGDSVANNNETRDVEQNEQEVSFSPSSHKPPRTSQEKKNGRKSEGNKGSKRMSTLFNGGLFPSFHKKRADGHEKNDTPGNEDDIKSMDRPTCVEDDETSVATGGLVFVAEDESGLGFSIAPMDNQKNNENENQTVMHTVGDDILPIEIGGPESLPSLARSDVPKSRASTGTMTHTSEHFNRSRQPTKSRASLGMPQRSFQQPSAGILPQVNGGHRTEMSSRRATSIHYFSDDSEEE